MFMKVNDANSLNDADSLQSKFVKAIHILIKQRNYIILPRRMEKLVVSTALRGFCKGKETILNSSKNKYFLTKELDEE